MSDNTSSAAPSEPRPDYAKALNIRRGQPIRVEYFTKPTTLPSSFLLPSPPADMEPMSLTAIDFSKTTLPENAGRIALVLDNVLSPSECQTLLSLAESSVDLDRLNTFWNSPGDASPWRPALVNAGQGYEVLEPEYRNSDRIVWDSDEVVARLWARCLHGKVGEALGVMLSELNGADHAEVLGEKKKAWRWDRPSRWAMKGLNKRMRFLKYARGQFFAPHCDGNYSEKVGDTVFKTFFTMHLYLNDSVAEVGEQAELVGGATSFTANDGGERKVDVDPKMGRVLIFQQQGLYHAGDDVLEGTKYTMRTEIMYALVEKTQWTSTRP
ncbi:hypothetical protein N0V93_008788 [Gnomoniopsis smithogilvyi]|uniref:Prolyl 4-hydroxylase alpha subunit domain-containing protein n=1 Tax=Gnomoniopsis smithogilvyi TaxID=1191159 RepID=A0A9W8YND6_9PEZI|nr:hypothetical protein N0V93_008788 [Gnomoniopsis smithogilvyi]